MATLFLLTVLIAKNGSFAPAARSRSTLNVSLVTQNNRSIEDPFELSSFRKMAKTKTKVTKWVKITVTVTILTDLSSG